MRGCHDVTALQPGVKLSRWTVGLSYHGSRRFVFVKIFCFGKNNIFARK